MSLAPPEEVDLNAIPGARALIGYSIDAGEVGGPVRTSLVVEARHGNRNGRLHGGIISMMLDAACGFTVSKHFGGGLPTTALVTLNLSTNFIGSVQIGERVTAVGQFTGGGRRIAYASGEMRAEDGRVIATAQASFRAITPQA